MKVLKVVPKPIQPPTTYTIEGLTENDVNRLVYALSWSTAVSENYDKWRQETLTQLQEVVK